MLEPVWLQHGGRKPVVKTFVPSVKLENIRVGTSLNILVTQNSKT